MPTNYDAANPEHFALMGQTDADLRARGLSDEEIAALRDAQWNTPPATSAEQVASARRAAAKAPAKREKAE